MASSRRDDDGRARIDLGLRLEDRKSRGRHVRQSGNPAARDKPTVGPGPIELRVQLDIVPGRLPGPEVPQGRLSRLDSGSGEGHLQDRD